MNTFPIANRKFLAASILAISFVLSLALIHAEAASNDSSIKIEKDPFSGKFTLTMKDPDGIQEFSFSLVGRYSYGGGLSSCPKSFSSNNVSLMDPSDFTPVMPAYIVDCKNNKTELEIPPPVDGVTKSVLVKKEEAPPPAPSQVEKKEEKKGPAPSEVEGPLSKEDIQYPVPNLGSCQNETECRSYCDNADHAKECFAFAKKYHLISKEEAQKAADHFLNVRNGPGGCNSGKSCEAYCSTVEHIDECITFAEETGYYKPEELAEAKKFQALVKAGTKFPGGCTERNACEIYCSDPNNMEECLNFAEESGFMPPEEIAEARKFMILMRQGESPGGCTSKEQCENYCFEDSHIDECIAFAEKAGVMSAEDAQMARKVGGKGPGGCRSKEQCEAYCEENSEECFNFAKEHGLMSEDDLEHMREGMVRFREELDKMPPEAVQCMKDAIGEENFNKMLAGEPVFDRSMEGKMKSCFGQITAEFSQQLGDLPPKAAQCIKDAIGEEGLKKLQSGELDENLNFESLESCFQQLKASFGDGSSFGAGGFSGPGGCKNMEECTAYCQEHYQECQGFGPPGDDNGEFGGPDTSFSDCVSKGMNASYVCAINGRGAPPGVETTYFNECHAKQHGVEILHEGVCIRNGQPDKPCSDVADPVCGNDNNTWVSACHAEDQGGGVQYEGICKSNTSGFQGSGFSGPGGCTNQEECTAYCTQHYTDPACQKFMPPNGGGGDDGIGDGPGGCQSQEECQAYCQANPRDAELAEECQTYFYCQAHPQECGGGTPTLPSGFGAPCPWQDFNPVCSEDSVTYDSACIARQQGEENVREGACTGLGFVPCEKVFKPVCAEQTSTSNGGIENYYNACVAKGRGATVLYEGECKTGATSPTSTTAPPSNFSGPGGCKNPEECVTYCTQHYQDPACQQFMPPATSSSLPSSSLLGVVFGPWLLLLK